MRADGMSTRQIAKVVGVSKDTVRRWSEAGVSSETPEPDENEVGDAGAVPAAAGQAGPGTEAGGDDVGRVRGGEGFGGQRLRRDRPAAAKASRSATWYRPVPGIRRIRVAFFRNELYGMLR
ncbi:MAG: hypothetical protein C0501_14620 [Isosphaera sp.]|nr:hypothetical protein [Isosphaera sp.]